MNFHGDFCQSILGIRAGIFYRNSCCDSYNFFAGMPLIPPGGLLLREFLRMFDRFFQEFLHRFLQNIFRQLLPELPLLFLSQSLLRYRDSFLHSARVSVRYLSRNSSSYIFKDCASDSSSGSSKNSPGIPSVVPRAEENINSII